MTKQSDSPWGGKVAVAAGAIGSAAIAAALLYARKARRKERSLLDDVPFPIGIHPPETD